MFNNCSIELASVRCSARQGGGGGPTGEGSGPARAMLTGGEATLVVMHIKQYTGRGGGWPEQATKQDK
jgi:hypothetical protein